MTTQAKRRLPKSTPPPEPNCEEMVFDADEQIVPIKIKVKEGHVEEYRLREATGDAVCKWRNAMMNQTVLLDGKPSKIKNMADAEPFLVSLCLYTMNGTNVPVQIIRSWKASIQKALYKRLRDISDIEEEEDDSNLENLIEQRNKLDERIVKIEEGVSAAKNEQTDTSDG